jgi:hypothetical protein
MTMTQQPSLLGLAAATFVALAAAVNRTRIPELIARLTTANMNAATFPAARGNGITRQFIPVSMTASSPLR